MRFIFDEIYEMELHWLSFHVKEWVCYQIPLKRLLCYNIFPLQFKETFKLRAKLGLNLKVKDPSLKTNVKQRRGTERASNEVSAKLWLSPLSNRSFIHVWNWEGCCSNRVLKKSTLFTKRRIENRFVTWDDDDDNDDERGRENRFVPRPG